MSDAPARESPLAKLRAARRAAAHPSGPGVAITERPFLGHLNLRGDPGDASFLAAARAVLGLGVPLEPNTVSEAGELAALWLGPNEWLLVTPPGREEGVAHALGRAVSGLFAAVTDVSGGQTVISLRGRNARDVLAKGCSLDLHPRAFGPGRCAQSLVARVGVIIWQRDAAPSYDLIVRRSLAEYLALWLEDAAREYGVAAGRDDI